VRSTTKMMLVAGFLPEGAISVIGDQIHRIATQSNSTLGVAFAGTLLLSLWGANAGTKSIFEALNIIYKENEKRGFIRLTLQSLLFTIAGLVDLIGRHVRGRGSRGAKPARHSPRVDCRLTGTAALAGALPGRPLCAGVPLSVRA
jgi:virulence factor BrkB